MSDTGKLMEEFRRGMEEIRPDTDQFKALQDHLENIRQKHLLDELNQDTGFEALQDTLERGPDDSRPIEGPISLYVGPYRYYLYYATPVTNKNLYDKFIKQEDEGLAFGHVNHEEQIIVVNGVCSDSRQSAAVLHEILHAIDVAYGMDLAEQEITVLATALIEALTSNYELSKKMFKNRRI